MTAEGETFKALDRAFLTALLLTGRTEVAESAVLDGIAALEFEHISGDSLILRSVKSAVERQADSPDPLEQVFSILPVELRRVLLLAPGLRHGCRLPGRGLPILHDLE